MSQYLIGNLTPEFWYTNPEVGWLSPDDAMGDALRDLRIKDNALSVFEVDDGAAIAHIHRIVAAIAAKQKTEPVDVGYRLIDPAKVKQLNIAAVPTRGKLGDSELNRLHRDLTNISAIKLGQLAATIAHSAGGQLSAREFERIVRREVGAGRLAPEGVNGDLRRALGL